MMSSVLTCSVTTHWKTCVDWSRSEATNNKRLPTNTHTDKQQTQAKHMCELHDAVQHHEDSSNSIGLSRIWTRKVYTPTILFFVRVRVRWYIKKKYYIYIWCPQYWLIGLEPIGKHVLTEIDLETTNNKRLPSSAHGQTTQTNKAHVWNTCNTTSSGFVKFDLIFMHVWAKWSNLYT